VLLFSLFALGQQTQQISYRSVPDFFKLPVDIYLGEAAGVAVNSHGEIFVFHRGTHPLLEFRPDGTFVRSIADGLYGFEFPHAVRVDGQDNLWTVDEGANVIVKFSPVRRVLMVLGRKPERVESATPGVAPQRPEWQFNRPTDVAFGPAGEIFVSDGYGNSRIVKYNRDGELIKTWGRRGAAPGEFHTPHTLVTDAAGKVYVGDRENKRIQVFDGDGNFQAAWDQVGVPWALCITPPPRQFIYMADATTGEIKKLDLSGKVLGTFGKSGKRLGEFGWVHELACPAENTIYAAELLNWRVQKLTLGPVR
jgi:DNA-binding beta-propeller fold protein YncE